MLEKQLLKHIGKLSQKKYRREYGQFIVEGEKGVREALKHGLTIALVIQAKRQEEASFVDLADIARKKNIELLHASNLDVNKIKTTTTFSGAMAICSIPETELEDLDYTKPLLYLENISDPGNLGTLIRSADWFGIGGIILSENSVDPYNDKVVRSTMGSIFRMPIVASIDDAHTLQVLKQEQYEVAVLDMKGEDISKAKITPKVVIALGSESHGISAKLDNIADSRYTIPGHGNAESLNVGVAGGIAMHTLLSK